MGAESSGLGKVVRKLRQLGKVETYKKCSNDVKTPTEFNLIAFFVQKERLAFVLSL